MKDNYLIKDFLENKNINSFNTLYFRYKDLISDIANKILFDYMFLKESNKYLLYISMKDFDFSKGIPFKVYLCKRVKWFYLNSINKQKISEKKHETFSNHCVNIKKDYKLLDICRDFNLSILIDKFFKGKSLTEISKDLSCSPSHASNLFKKEIQKLKQNI